MDSGPDSPLHSAIKEYVSGDDDNNENDWENMLDTPPSSPMSKPLGSTSEDA